MNAGIDNPPLYRVWVVRYHAWRPSRWDDMPPAGRVVEPVVDACLIWEEACAVLAGFNETMLASRHSVEGRLADGHAIDPLWAVATPVALRREGDMTPGQRTEPAVLLTGASAGLLAPPSFS